MTRSMVFGPARDHTSGSGPTFAPIPPVTLAHWPSRFVHRPGAPSAVGDAGAVASTDALATAAGLTVLQEGGNAVDAAVAVAFALAVVNPEAGNLGGGGFLLVRTPDGRVFAQDHRSAAPAAARPDMFWTPDGGVSEASVIGPRAAAVPGTVRGLWEAHGRLGTLPWARLVEPSIALAEGFEVGARFLASFPPHIVAGLARFGSSASIFLPDGAPPAAGSRLRQPDLAETLRRIRDRGADGFYEGATAEGLVAAMAPGGGLITREDLRGYRAAWREPVRFGYRRHTVWAMPPSSSGGVTLAVAAHALARYDVGALPWRGAEHLHLLVEAWRRAFADRNRWLADPDHAAVPLVGLLDPAYGAARGADIDPGRASTSDGVEAGVPAGAPLEGRHTTHVSVVDASGGGVAYTTTLNTWYGSKRVAPGTGVLLNNEMDDFTTRPGVPNFFGLIQGAANAIGPGKRPLSAMTPTIVESPDGRLRWVLGSPGGATIITTVFQLLTSLLDHGLDLPDAVSAPRIHHQHRPDRIDVEPGALPGHVADALRERGHVVREASETWGDVEAVAVHPDGRREAVADPRRGGSARAC